MTGVLEQNDQLDQLHLLLLQFKYNMSTSHRNMAYKFKWILLLTTL